MLTERWSNLIRIKMPNYWVGQISKQMHETSNDLIVWIWQKQMFTNDACPFLCKISSIHSCSDDALAYCLHVFMYQYESANLHIPITRTAHSEIWLLHLTRPWGAVDSHSAVPGDWLQILASTKHDRPNTLFGGGNQSTQKKPMQTCWEHANFTQKGPFCH